MPGILLRVDGPQPIEAVTARDPSAALRRDGQCRIGARIHGDDQASRRDRAHAPRRPHRRVDVLEAARRPSSRPGVVTELDASPRRYREAGVAPSFLGYGSNPAFPPRSASRSTTRSCTASRPQAAHPGRRRRQPRPRVHLQGLGRRLGAHRCVGDAATARGRSWSTSRAGRWRRGSRGAPGNRLGDVGAAIETVVNEHGFGVVREYVGHGVGHADARGAAGAELRRGRAPVCGSRRAWCCALEPMVTWAATADAQLDDDWTVVTADGSLSAHFEHTVGGHR